MEPTSVTNVVLIIAGFLAAFLLQRISSSLDRLTDSVISLDSKMAVIIARIDQHEKRISKLEDEDE